MAINDECEKAYKEFIREVAEKGLDSSECKFLNCNAKIGQVGRFIYLRSYNTIVAIIDNESLVMYDVLRLVYGYTATSAQHISKFARHFNHIERMTYMDV